MRATVRVWSGKAQTSTGRAIRSVIGGPILSALAGATNDNHSCQRLALCGGFGGDPKGYQNRE